MVCFAAASCSGEWKNTDAAVLGAVVGTLAVQLGGVVELEELFEKLLVGDLRGIVVDLDGFGVAGAIGTRHSW